MIILRRIRSGALRPIQLSRALVWCTSWLFLACATSGAAAKPVAEPHSLNDPQISSEIDDVLVHDGAVPVDDIQVATSDGIVTLTGTVQNLLARDRALRLAETVKGVRSVIDRIEVKPVVMLTDRELAKDVEDALFYDPATESYEIDARALNGKVTLTGTVDSYTEHQLAERVAKGVNGVRAVDNQLAISYKEERGIDQIRADIQERLRWDALVDAHMIQVGVDSGGAVHLKGAVGSAAEKRRAASDAWVSGVHSVDDSKLDVDYQAYDKNRRHRFVPETDEAIEGAVHEALQMDPRVNAFEIDVESKVGQVVLRGAVDNLGAKDAAAQIARATTGVASVENRLTVKPRSVSDARIESKVIGAIVRDPYLQPYDISVDAHDGVVSLSGNVDSYFDKVEADRVATRASGIRRVDNGLVVEHPDRPLVYQPLVSEVYPYTLDWYDYRPRRSHASDGTLQVQIENELWWSPYVDSSDIKVEVHGGVATLEGNVGSYAAMDAAVANAYEGGAVWVNNDLKVGHR